MIKYAIITDNKNGRVEIGDGTNIDYYISTGMTEMNVDKSEVDGNWYLYDKCPHYSEEEKEQKELERVSHLKCTKRVLVLILEQLDKDYFKDIEPLINNNRQAKLEWDLCVELERSNPLLDILGAELSISHATIDKIFKYANGEIGKEDFDETDIVKGGIANG